MEHENDGDTSGNWDVRYSHQRFCKTIRNKEMSGNHPNYSIVEISQNTEKSLGDFKRLAVTQTPVKDAGVKNFQKIIITIMIIIIWGMRHTNFSGILR